LNDYLPEFSISFSVAKVKESIILETREPKVVTSSIFEKSWLEPEILTFDEKGLKTEKIFSF
jgi:hypothetical protein